MPSSAIPKGKCTSASLIKVELPMVQAPKDGIGVEDNAEVTAAEHTSNTLDESIILLFNDEVPKKASPESSSKRTRSASQSSLISLDSNSDGEKPPKKQKTSPEAPYSIHGRFDPRPRGKPHPALVKLRRSMVGGCRPRPSSKGHIAQKISIGAQIAKTWDPYQRRKLADDTTKLDIKAKLAKERPDIANIAPTTRFRSWKDENDQTVTWKVFPKSTPRMKHRGGMVVVETLMRDPAGHPDVTICEYEEDSSCWIARVEELSEEAIAGRREELTAAAKAERMQRGRRGGDAGAGAKRRATASPKDEKA